MASASRSPWSIGPRKRMTKALSSERAFVLSYSAFSSSKAFAISFRAAVPCTASFRFG